MVALFTCLFAVIFVTYKSMMTVSTRMVYTTQVRHHTRLPYVRAVPVALKYDVEE